MSYFTYNISTYPYVHGINDIDLKIYIYLSNEMYIVPADFVNQLFVYIDLWEDKTIEKPTKHTIIWWSNPKQWQMSHTSDFIVIHCMKNN